MRLPCRMGILLLPKSEDCGMIYLYKFFSVGGDPIDENTENCICCACGGSFLFYNRALHA